MTVAAAPLSIPTAPAAKRITLSLAQKFAIAFLGLVAAVLIINGAIDMGLTYRDARVQAVKVQQEKANAAAERVVQFVTEIEQQLGWTTRAEWSRISVEQRRYDFIRLLRQAPAITELVHVDGAGKEQLKLSRLEPDQVGSNTDYSADPRFTATIRDKTFYGPVTFRRGSEPYMTIGIAHAGRTPGATIADVNLKLAWDVVTSIHVGNTGYAYITDPDGRLIAHPDMSLVLRNTDLKNLPQVAAARADAANGATAVDGIDQDGRGVLSANAKVPKVGWNVFVELPAAEALGPVWSAFYQTLGLLALGVALAGLAGTLLAQRMVVPITELQAGAQKLGEGDLASRIPVRSSDEIGALAARFNTMAGQIQESQENLERKVDERTADLNEALQQQTATAEVLKVISRSTFDLQKILDVLVETVARLCEADGATLARQIGDGYVRAGMYGFDEAFVDAARRMPFNASRGSVSGRALIEARTIQIADIREDPEYTWTEAKELGRIRTTVGIPLMREHTPIGVISLARFSVRPFSEKQIELLQTFADQAVIAIENARLFNETKEALERQNATSEVLQVISGSVANIQPVFDVIAERAAHLTRADYGWVFLLKEQMIHAASSFGINREGLEAARKAFPTPLSRASITGQAISSGNVIKIPDVMTAPEIEKKFKDLAMLAGNRSTLSVPMRHAGNVIGAITVQRSAVGDFAQKEVDVLETFADQAVIAIENARLFNETQEALAQQTATSDILRVISGSPTDVKPVYNAMVEAAVRLLACDWALVLRTDGKTFSPVAGATPTGPMADMGPSDIPVDPDHNFPSRAIVSKSVLHLPDWSEIDLPPHEQHIHDSLGLRSALYVPLVRDNVCQGVMVYGRGKPGSAFNPKDIALAASFRDQALIAIENARLFNETKEALEQRTATAEVLKVIAASPSDVAPVLGAIVERACDVCGAYDAAVLLKEGTDLRFSAHHGPIPIGLKSWPLNRNWTAGRAVIDKKPVHIRDLQSPEGDDFPDGRELSVRMGHRSILSVPLIREGNGIGALVVRRAEVDPFTEKQIELLTTFADQAVIAIGNVQLFKEAQDRTKELSKSLADLHAAQDRLVQTEKLASLGQLTAGVAHEIKNPLNFVNNFADLSIELVTEIEEAITSAGRSLDPKIKAEVDEIAGMLKGNLAKVVHHGRRADSIVKNMLAHSRESGGERRRIDLNAAVDEALNLAYHGARAETPGFNITLERDFDPAIGQTEVFPQEFTRVLLNLIGNGFHAANKKRLDGAPAGFEPTLRVSTKAFPNRVEIKVRDNGTGIPDAVKARIFEPFFTTKPTGEGTGLGLSLSHDIVVKQHGGSLAVVTEPGSFTEFTVTLPSKATTLESIA